MPCAKPIILRNYFAANAALDAGPAVTGMDITPNGDGTDKVTIYCRPGSEASILEAVGSVVKRKIAPSARADHGEMNNAPCASVSIFACMSADLMGALHAQGLISDEQQGGFWSVRFQAGAFGRRNV